MDFTICYLEVFDEETKQWEYVANSNEPEEINSWYNNLDEFFDLFNLYFLCAAIENKEQLALFVKYKWLPINCSKPIENACYFVFEEVKMCKSASYFNLSELLEFDYDNAMNLNEIAKKDLKIFYPEIYKSKKQVINHKEWLGEDFFIELYDIKQRFSKYPNCRIVYFVY